VSCINLLVYVCLHLVVDLPKSVTSSLQEGGSNWILRYAGEVNEV